MLTLFQVASNPAILKTREGLRWLCGYSEAICDDNKCNLSFDAVMDSLKWDMNMVLDEAKLQASFLPDPAYVFSVTDLPF